MLDCSPGRMLFNLNICQHVDLPTPTQHLPKQGVIVVNFLFISILNLNHFDNILPLKGRVSLRIRIL